MGLETRGRQAMRTFEVWVQDPEKVEKVVETLVSEGIMLSMKIGGALLRTRAVMIHYHEGVPWLLLSKPEGLPKVTGDITLYFKMKGQPIRQFPLACALESDTLLAGRLPTEIYQLQLRKHPRFLLPAGSLVSFQVPNRTRTNVCSLADISLGGARIVGTPKYEIEKDKRIGPFTLTLSEYQAVVVREVTIYQGRVARVAPMDRFSDRVEMGIEFLPDARELEMLTRQIHYLTRESPFPLLKAPCPFQMR